MTIHKDCIKTALGIWLGAGALIFLTLWFVPWAFVSYPICAILLFIMGFALFFFRVPSRVTVTGDNVVTSVADGMVCVIEKVYEPEYVEVIEAAGFDANVRGETLGIPEFARIANEIVRRKNNG